jgi:protein phosphatase inhibitor 2
MKITEPKTPYVRYNAETDEIEGGQCILNPALNGPLCIRLSCSTVSQYFVDIPNLDLDRDRVSGSSNHSGSPAASHSPLDVTAPGPNSAATCSRRSSVASIGRSGSVRSSSGGSSRSTSFSLPKEATGEIRAAGGAAGEEVEVEEEMDEASA